MTARSIQADSCTATGDGRTILSIMTPTSKTAPACTHSIRKLIRRYIVHFGRKQRQKYYFLSIIKCGQTTTVEKFDYSVP